MKIGIITGEYPPMQGGVGDFTRELAAALAELGHEVHVITGTGSTAHEDSPHDGKAEGRPRRMAQSEIRGTKHGTRPTVHPIVPHWGWRFYGCMMDLTRRLNLDVLNVQYQAAAYDLHPAINFLPLFLTRLSGWRVRSSVARPSVIVTFHDLKVPYLFPKAGPLRDWVVTALARHADAAVVTNRADELALTARGVQRVERIPIGSNIAPRLPDDYDRQAWRARLGIAPEECLLGFFGFFNARKGVETLITALTGLDRSYHLLFIGGTVGSSDATNRAYADRMEALILDRGLADRVHYTGYLPATEVSAAFGAVDLCILPYADGISFHHGTLMAALAHGQAIISTHATVALPEVVHGENVWLVAPEDPGALITAIAHLSDEPERRQRLGQGAAELSAQFSWESIASRTAELFERSKREN